jgi:hypothetical protein
MKGESFVSTNRRALTLALILLITIGAGIATAAPIEESNTPLGATREPSEQTVLESLRNSMTTPDDPYAAGGYPDELPAFAVPGPEVDGAFAEPAAFNTGVLCSGNDVCLTGDFNADGRDDVAVLKGDFATGAEVGDVLVALSSGASFQPRAKWLEYFCTGGSVCKVADVNGDNRDDLVNFARGAEGSPNRGNVTVALSTGTAFSSPALWHPYFCIGQEVCDVGDFNGDNRADIVLFKKSLYAGSEGGDVLVSLSNGFNQFLAVGKWQDVFCTEDELCRVGDFNGDNRDDIVAFAQRSIVTPGRVNVALSQGGSFNASPAKWQDYFCPGYEQCEIGDFDANGMDDLLAFAGGGYPENPSTYGDTYVALSGGNSFLPGQKWHDMFCTPGEDCAVGDFNGDGRDDIVRFVKSNGSAFVALATGTATGFILTPGNPPGKWADYFCINQEQCQTGDFNGDGLTDIAYLVRSTQAGVGEGDVFVALSNGYAFGTPQKWHEYFCLGQDNCQVGDFNADGLDDLVSFSRVTNGLVYVTLSTGNGFGTSTLWNTFFCPNPEWCEVGDFNGDGADDIVTFLRNTYGDTRAGEVNVALSVPNAAQFVTVGRWNGFFCIGNEWCDTGDFNGDGRDDIITFTKGSNANVYVGLSTGVSFLDGQKWHDFFCAGNEQCRIADVDGEGKDDIVTFLRSDYAATSPSTVGDVIVGLSDGGRFLSQPKWNDFFCINQEYCDVGDFNGNGTADIVTFIKSTVGDRAGDVYVATSQIGTGFYFTNAMPPDARRLYLPLTRR